MAEPSHGPSASTSSTSLSGFFSRRPSLFTSARHQHHHSHSQAPLTASNSNRAPPKGPGPPHSRTRTPPQHPVSHQSASPPKVPTTPPRRKHASRHSISSSVAEIGTSLRRSRSASLRTNTSSGAQSSHKRTPSATLALSFSPEKAATATHVQPAPASRPTLSISTFARSKQKSAENVKQLDAVKYEKSPLSAVDNPKTPFGMAVPVPLRYPPSQKEIQQAQRQQSTYGASYNGGLGPAAAISSVPNGANPNAVFQHIHEMASKRISTLDYLRKAHEGRIYWFNTLLFAKTDLTRLPSFTPRNLARRATNFLLLGFSLPTILDLNANSPTDYLKALNALLVEFETYQSIHPPDGATSSSLSRGRINHMFKRPTIMGGKGRRSSSATGDFPSLTPQNTFNESASSVDLPPTDDLLLPNESYTHLQTPSLPFDPDFFSTFATLCDVLIDCYTRILSMFSTPESVSIAGGGVPSIVGDLFSKADARIRKIILAGMVREFEESCRQGVRTEIGGVGKVVLGGLM